MLLAGCSALGATSLQHPAPRAVAAVADRPNLVFVLTDDLSTDLVRYMPNLQAMMRRGASFTNYFVTDSLCCPSRASIFTGMYPHSSGVHTNTGTDGGLFAFNRNGNPSRSFAVALQRAGYRTALMGKYLNGYEPEMPPARGWDDWAVAGNAYREYNYDLNDNGRTVHYGDKSYDYLTDVLARRARQYIDRAAKPSNASRRPFALEVSTFNPHDPFVAALRDRERFGSVGAPRTPAFGHDSVGNPPWLDLPALTPDAIATIDAKYRLRVQAVQALDRMIGALQRQIRAPRLASNTYLVFSSDNGFHMGEHRLRGGKMTAFDTDIRVPLVVVGPGIRPGMRIDALAANVDLAPTFIELAGRTPPAAIEGRSLVPLLAGRRPADWRRAVLVEHQGPDLAPTDPDFPAPFSGNPPSYNAIRLEKALYVEYVDGEREYYDHVADPYQLRNAYEDLEPDRRTKLSRNVDLYARCRGATACHRADQLPSAPS
jgi:arylsulfatase A-like enzyme